MDDKIKKAIEEGERARKLAEEARLCAEEEKIQERLRRAKDLRQQRLLEAVLWGASTLPKLIQDTTAAGGRVIKTDTKEKADVARSLGLTVKEVYHPGWIATGSEKADGGYDVAAWTDWEISW